MKLMEFSLQGPRTVCVISGNGTISSVTLRYPTCGGTLTHEVCFCFFFLIFKYLISKIENSENYFVDLVN